MFRLARVPSQPLSRFIALLWYQHVLPGQFGPELVLPSGAAELVVVLGPSPHVAATGTVCGPHSTYFRLERPPVAHALVGVHFHPGGLQPLLGAPGRRSALASDLHNQIVTLEDIWGRDALLLHERLMLAPSARDRLHIMEHELQQRLLVAEVTHRTMPAAVGLLQRATGSRPVDAVAHHLGYSVRRIQQYFREEVGLSPKTFHRVSRFQTVLQRLGAMSADRPAIHWADLALAHNYFDQAHLIHDFRTFTSLSPTAFLLHRTAQIGHLSQTTRDTAPNT